MGQAIFTPPEARKHGGQDAHHQALQVEYGFGVMDGFKLFIAGLPDALPGILVDWILPGREST